MPKLSEEQRKHLEEILEEQAKGMDDEKVREIHEKYVKSVWARVKEEEELPDDRERRGLTTYELEVLVHELGIM